MNSIKMNSIKRSFSACLSVALVVFAGFGCMAANNSRTSPEAYQVTDPARALTVTPGEKFVIVLDSNRTTGFSWQIEKPIKEEVIKLLGSEYLPSNSALEGAGGKEIWTFSAVSAGQATIHFKYVRPWERGKPPEKEAAYTVIVR